MCGRRRQISCNSGGQSGLLLLSGLIFGFLFLDFTETQFGGRGGGCRRLGPWDCSYLGEFRLLGGLLLRNNKHLLMELKLVNALLFFLGLNLGKRKFLRLQP